jgi:hypothetical protein
MRHYKAEFGKLAKRLSGASDAEVEAVAAGGAGWFAEIAWAVWLAIWLVLSFVLAKFVLSGDATELVLSGMWAFFLGITMLLFFPQKLLITIFGGVAGVGMTDLAGLAPVIEKTAAAIRKITQALNAGFEGELVIRPMSVWLFLGIVLLCCLPAYRGTEA